MTSPPGSVTPARNLELKARLASLDVARGLAEQVATERLPPQHQVDTYFPCARGRLKLREIDGRQAQLVWYERPDGLNFKASDYVLAPVDSPEPVKAALAGALGTAIVVEKRRDIFLHHNVRIHLDDVVGLGPFLEFEAVLGPHASESESRARLEFLKLHFGVRAGDLVAGSYRDLLAASLAKA